jgi:hypothetical protein
VEILALKPLDRILLKANFLLAVLTGIVAAMAAFNWMVPAPDSSIRLHPLYPAAVGLFGLSSLLFYAASRKFKTRDPAKWWLSILAMAPIVAFYVIRFSVFAG